MEPALIYDGSETLSVTREQAEALQFFGLVGYSPEDGPFGIMYRPMPGWTLDEIKLALAVDPKAIGVSDHSDSS